MDGALLYPLIALQAFVVAFIALHDWIPLGRLNDVKAVQAADPAVKLAMVTVSGALPFAIGLVASVRYAATGFPAWLFWWLWISYGVAVFGMLRAWWIPYLLLNEPERAARYRSMFARTHAFLPMRNGIRPNTLHVIFHLVLVAIVGLLAKLTF